MFIGHFAPALALHRTRPSVPLWVLFLSTQAVDLLWGAFILAHVEHARIVPGFTESNALDLYDMPYTHSLVATVVWGASFAALWSAVAPGRRVEALVVGLAVASHFVLDLVVHVPDLPVAGTDGPMLGLGLWRHREVALLVEGTIFAAAAIYWLWAKENRTARGAVTLGGMGAILVASYYAPPMSTPEAMAGAGFTTSALAAFAAWWITRPVERTV